MTVVRLHCVVCDNAMDYFKYLLENYRSLASPDAKIEVIAHCTDDESYRQVVDGKIANRAIAVHRRPEFYVYGNRHDVINRIKLLFGMTPRLGGSSGHAAGIKSAFLASGGEGIDIIADTDTVILVRDWDKRIESILQDVAVMGTSYEKKGGTSSGDSNVQTYKTAPNLTWMAFSSKYPFKTLDPSHMLYKNLPITTQEQADLYGVGVGCSLLRDIGWKMPQFLKDHHAKACMLDNFYPESGQCKVLKVANHYNEEFQLNGEPFIAHQRGSRKHKFKSEPLSAPFYKAVEDYLAR